MPIKLEINDGHSLQLSYNQDCHNEDYNISDKIAETTQSQFCRSTSDIVPEFQATPLCSTVLRFSYKDIASIMPPIRRYLRITKYSVLEVRIYLDNPALSSWLLHPSHPVLPRIISSIRPLVLPKLREENERSNPKNKTKGKKKKAVKDVVLDEQGEFEVAIFLTELGNRHSLLKRQKVIKEKEPLKSNSSKMLGGFAGASISVEDVAPAPSIMEEAEEDNVLGEIPEAETIASDDDEFFSTMPVRKRRRKESDALFVEEDSDETTSKRSRLREANEDDGDDKKKMALDTTYDGFSIYGKALCLIVKKRDVKGKEKTKPAGQAMMEDWITSTQMPVENLG